MIEARFRVIAIVAAILGNVFVANGQFETIYIGVNGLTCSQCSRTVEMSIRKLDFVADVQMNLQHTDGKILLLKNKKVNIEKIARAVMDAGFSVRFLEADFGMGNTEAISGSCFNYNGDSYEFIEEPRKPLQGTVKFRFVGKKYLPKNDFKKMERYFDDKCSQNKGTLYYVEVL